MQSPIRTLGWQQAKVNSVPFNSLLPRREKHRNQLALLMMNAQASLHLLSAILRYHERGYQRLRVMPIVPGTGTQFLVGPRKYFSELDGAFVPQDLRTRCVSYEARHSVPNLDLLTLWHWGNVLPFDSRERQGFFSGKSEDERSFEDSLIFKNFKEWLDASWGSDQAYAEWFRALHEKVSDGEGLVPCRLPFEATKSTHAILLLRDGRNLEKEIDQFALTFDPPPSGVAASSGSWKPKPHEIAIAQPREPNAPSLIWAGGTNRCSDPALDAWFENQ